MIRALAIVSLLLLVSLAFNVVQYGRRSADEARGEVRDALTLEIARSQGRADALAETAGRNAQLADWARLDSQTLLLDLGQLVERGRERKTVYRDRVQAMPALACAPGEERMDAFNAAIGAAP